MERNPSPSSLRDRSHPFLDGKVKRLLIDGEWGTSASGKTFSSIDPSTGGILADIAEGGEEDLNRAVAAARRAFDGGEWSRFKPYERQQVLLKFADLLDKHYDEIARLESLDYGGAISRTIPRRRRHLSLLRYYAALAVSIHGETVENSIPGTFVTYTLKQPVGVVGGIYAWNAPLDMAIWKIGPVLATGCTIVVKPATEAALTALRLGELLMEAGLPKGVVNIVPGGADVGNAMANHPGIDKITFTGSTATGQSIVRASAGNLKRLSLELGGKSPDIVFDDADLDAAIPGAGMGTFGNSGQSCAAGTRVFVQRRILDEFMERMAAFGKSLKVGDALDPASDLGPVISARQMDRVLGYIDAGRAEGGRVMAGGQRPSDPALAKGYFIEPTVFGGLTDEMKIVREEIFGPVMCVLPFDDLEEVVRRGNASPYGLAGGVWTRDLNRAHRVAKTLCAGSVWVNCYTQLDPAMPFGGFKMSGYGRESGVQHLDSFLETKSVTIRLG